MNRWIAIILFLFSSYAGALQIPTHMQYNNYEFISSAPEGFYNYDMHITWHKEPDVSKVGFYAQFGFDFQAGTGGYTGLQQDSTQGKKAIFSIWDIGNAQTAFPVASNCRRFGHEGTGTMCLLPFQWKAGHEYKMRVWRLADSSNGSTEKWGGWVIDYVTGEETLIGVIEVNNSNGYRGYGGLIGTSVGVSEFYSSGNPAEQSITCDTMPYFGVTWNGPFANNGSVLPDAVRSTYRTGMGTPCPNNVRSVANAPFSITAENGGSTTAVNNEFQNVWEAFNLSNYKEVDCLYNWGEQLMPAAFNQALFKHRRLSRSMFGFYSRDYRQNGTGHALIANMTANRLILGALGGAMEDLGDLDYWKRQAGCKR